ANADEDTQHFHIGGPLRQRRVKTAATLFNGWEVETRGIRDRLQEIGIACIGIRSRNGRVLIYTQGRDRLLEDKVWIKIRVMPVVAVACPPAGVDGKLRQVSEPVSNQVGIDASRSAAHQRAKRIEICRSRSLGD